MEFINKSEERRNLIEEFSNCSENQLRTIIRGLYSALRMKIFFTKENKNSDMEAHFHHLSVIYEDLKNKHVLSRFLKYHIDAISFWIEMFEMILVRVQRREARMQTLRPRK